MPPRQLTGAAAKFRTPPAKAPGAQPPDAPPEKTRGAGALAAALWGLLFKGVVRSQRDLGR